MPAYDFRCKACSETFEVVRPSTDDSPVTCPSCGGDAKRVFTPVGVHFKGGGFHNTDYRAPRPSEAKPCQDAGSKPSCDGCPGAE